MTNVMLMCGERYIGEVSPEQAEVGAQIVVDGCEYRVLSAARIRGAEVREVEAIGDALAESIRRAAAELEQEQREAAKEDPEAGMIEAMKSQSEHRPANESDAKFDRALRQFMAK